MVVGISTFLSVVEVSCHRITCDFCWDVPAAAHRRRGQAPRLEAPPVPSVPSGTLRIGVRLSTISHVIPLRMLQDLNSNRWYFNVSECC